MKQRDMVQLVGEITASVARQHPELKWRGSVILENSELRIIVKSEPIIVEEEVS